MAAPVRVASSGFAGHVPGMKAENLHGGTQERLGEELAHQQKHREFFDAMADQTDKSGERSMSKEGMAAAFAAAEIVKSPGELDIIFALTDSDGNGRITWDEYLAVMDKEVGLGEITRKTGPQSVRTQSGRVLRRCCVPADGSAL